MMPDFGKLFRDLLTGVSNEIRHGASPTRLARDAAWTDLRARLCDRMNGLGVRSLSRYSMEFGPLDRPVKVTCELAVIDGVFQLAPTGHVLVPGSVDVFKIPFPLERGHALYERLPDIVHMLVTHALASEAKSLGEHLE